MPAFYNRATLNYGDIAIDSNTVQGELNAALSIEKTAVNASYRPGDTVTYAVTLTNAGASDASDLQLRDDLGAYAFGGGTRAPLQYVDGSAKYFVNGELQAAPVAELGNGLVFRGIRVPANGSAAILYAARVNEFAPLGDGAMITNTVRLDDAASAGTVVPVNPNGANVNPGGMAANSGIASANSAIAGANPGGASAPAANSAALARAFAQPLDTGAPALPAFASAVISPELSARLSIRKSLTPQTVSSGEELTYTLTISNEGATAVAASEGASVTDVFNPRMDIRSVRFNGAAWSAPANYSYDPATGVFSTAAGQLTVPAAGFAQDAGTGRWQIQPGESTIEITGTLR